MRRNPQTQLSPLRFPRPQVPEAFQSARKRWPREGGAGLRVTQQGWAISRPLPVTHCSIGPSPPKCFSCQNILVSPCGLRCSFSMNFPPVPCPEAWGGPLGATHSCLTVSPGVSLSVSLLPLYPSLCVSSHCPCPLAPSLCPLFPVLPSGTVSTLFSLLLRPSVCHSLFLCVPLWFGGSPSM